MPGFVYILKDDLDKYYVGSSENVSERFQSHLNHEVYTTRRMKNIKIVFTQEYPTIREAKQVEYKIKKLKRKDYIEKIVKEGRIRMKL